MIESAEWVTEAMACPCRECQSEAPMSVVRVEESEAEAMSDRHAQSAAGAGGWTDDWS